MSIYQKVAKIGTKFIGRDKLFKHGFNLSPMYRRSTGRIVHVSDDLHMVRVRIPISFRNRNYVNSIFGGSLFSATDPIHMVQLINILGDDYVVWDKSAEITFRIPAKSDVYADFTYTAAEILEIQQRIAEENEIEIKKSIDLQDKDGNRTFARVQKVLYVANKAYYLEKRKRRNGKTSE
ncbi:DUF4442 domain-containing protein [Cryomorphaceae bacterium]|nr:DUF4442 domain-containing protein [Cryomorphaceae bacterium]